MGLRKLLIACGLFVFNTNLPMADEIQNCGAGTGDAQIIDKGGNFVTVSGTVKENYRFREHAATGGDDYLRLCKDKSEIHIIYSTWNDFPQSVDPSEIQAQRSVPNLSPAEQKAQYQETDCANSLKAGDIITANGKYEMAMFPDRNAIIISSDPKDIHIKQEGTP